MAEKLIGTDIAPPDLVAKITGRAKYSEDFRAEGMVFAKLLLSPMPHARVTRIDASRALAMEGVIDVLLPQDVPQAEAPNESPLTDQPHYEGEPILAVAAVDETTAAEAIERIEVDFEPLPFTLDPLDSLRPDGPDAWVGGNMRERVDGGWQMRSFKWTAEDFSSAPEGSLPMGEPQDEWSLGDIDAGFAEADLILEETIAHQSLTHHPLEPRSAMAYWQNGRLYMHGSTQSMAQAHRALADLLDMELEDIVLISEFCGGGFGSKITITPQWAIPALLSRRINRPVMMRINRYEETYIGRARPGFQAWARMGFRSDGRMSAMDLYIVQDQGSYGGAGDSGAAANVASFMYQPLNMRYRGVSLFTNTPPRSSQRAPGGAAIVAMLEPLLDRAARELRIDRLDIRLLNAPDQNGKMGPRQSEFSSIFAREAIQLGADQFNWEQKRQLSGQRNGTKVTGVGIGVSPYTAGSSGYDGLLVLRPDGKLHIHQGIGNLGTHSVADTGRIAAELLGLGWGDVQVLWGDSSRHLPWSSRQDGSQTTHAHTRANHAAGVDARTKIQEIAARDLGGNASEYLLDDGRVFHPATGRGMTLGRVAERAVELGGRYDGHELPDDINEMTVASAQALAGTGLMGVARDNYERVGSIYSWVVGFAVIELDVETGQVDLIEYLGSADCGVVLHPRNLAAQIHGGAIQGFGQARSQKWVYDRRWGTAFAKRLYAARPPGILDAPLQMDWAAVGEPDPHTPVGAKGIGEPGIGAGSAAITSAIADALGGRCLCLTPLTTDVILAALEGLELPHRLLQAHA